MKIERLSHDNRSFRGLRSTSNARIISAIMNTQITASSLFTDLKSRIDARQARVGIIGLGYVGLPLALAFAAGWMKDPREHIGRLIVGVILLVGLIVVFVLVAAVIQVLAKDFLVPVMALEDLDFADGWHRLLAMISPEKGRFAIYLLLKLVLSIAAGILFSIIAIIPAVVVIVPSVVAVVAGKAAGLGLSVTTISLAIIFGTLLLLLLIYLIALVCVPATVFFPAYAMYFFASRYPNLDALLHPVPAPPAPELPPVPESPPPFEAPPLPPSAEPISRIRPAARSSTADR